MRYGSNVKRYKQLTPPDFIGKNCTPIKSGGELLVAFAFQSRLRALVGSVVFYKHATPPELLYGSNVKRYKQLTSPELRFGSNVKRYKQLTPPDFIGKNCTPVKSGGELLVAFAFQSRLRVLVGDVVFYKHATPPELRGLVQL